MDQGKNVDDGGPERLLGRTCNGVRHRKARRRRWPGSEAAAESRHRG